MLGEKKHPSCSSKAALVNFERCSAFPLASQDRVTVMCPQQPGRLNCLPGSLLGLRIHGDPFRETDAWPDDPGRLSRYVCQDSDGPTSYPASNEDTACAAFPESLPEKECVSLNMPVDQRPLLSTFRQIGIQACFWAFRLVSFGGMVRMRGRAALSPGNLS